jgi:glutaredoxin
VVDAREPRDEHADGGVRPGREPRSRSYDDPRALPVTQVTLYGAQGCHLCERARETVTALRDELDFELEEVLIDGDPELEARYRELLPVVEIDGEQAFVYFVQPDALRRRLAQADV